MSNTIHILLIEDDPVDRMLLEEVLYQAIPASPGAPKFSVNWVRSLAEGIALHMQDACDIIVADLNLCDSRGVETIERLTAAVENVPIVLLTGYVDEQLTFSVARYGIQDYLVKGEFDGALLLRTLRFAIDRHRLERRQRAVAQIELISQDPDELQPLLDYVVNAVSELLPTSAGVAVLFHDAEVGSTCLGAATSNCRHANSDELQAICQRIVACGETEAVADVTQHALPEVRRLAQYGLRAYISVPILQQSHCRGILCAMESSPRVYTPTDVDFMQTLTGRVALSISRIEMYEKLRSQARDLAGRNAELDAFSYTVAHDLRNLLSSVIGYAEMLIDDFEMLPSAKRLQYLEAVLTHGQKMEQVIDSLLTLARLRTVDMQPDVVNMDDVVREMIHRLQDMFLQVGANIHISGDWPRVIGHAGWLEEVWVNLVTNALKYGGKPPRVNLGATVLGEFVRFWVRDNGPGIAPADQARLFEPFVRLQPACAEGHGLGLSIVRRIVERCNGQVGVDSTPGNGSTFWFELPAYLGAPSTLPSTVLSTMPSTEEMTKPTAIKAKIKPK